MAKNADNARVYGGVNSAVYCAPKGTAFPTGLAAPAAAFNDAGWLDESGIEFDRKEDTKKLRAYQGATVIRTQTSSVDDTIKFVCLEETAVTLGLYYKGATPTTAAGTETYTVDNQTKRDVRAWVIDVFDGTIQKRYCLTGSVSGGKVAHKNDDFTSYEFELSIEGSYTVTRTAPAAA